MNRPGEAGPLLKVRVLMVGFLSFETLTVKLLMMMGWTGKWTLFLLKQGPWLSKGKGQRESKSG